MCDLNVRHSDPYVLVLSQADVELVTTPCKNILIERLVKADNRTTYFSCHVLSGKLNGRSKRGNDCRKHLELLKYKSFQIKGGTSGKTLAVGQYLVPITWFEVQRLYNTMRAKFDDPLQWIPVYNPKGENWIQKCLVPNFSDRRLTRLDCIPRRI